MVKGKRRRARKLGWRVRSGLFLGAALLVLFVANFVVQVARKPSELAAPLLQTTHKSPRETWAAYGDLFDRHATRIMTPELLAALAQAESSGNPAVTSYWKWRWTLNPFRMFSPASSAVGLFQITDGTFEHCRVYCVQDGKVEKTRAWYDPRGCWFNGFYNRLVPSHAVEMMSACLESDTEGLLGEGRMARAPLEFKQEVAVLSHLCGPRAKAVERVLRGRKLSGGLRCGDHDPRAYWTKVRALRTEFARLRAER